MTSYLVALLLIVDLALFIVAIRWPLGALRWLLVALPLHSMATLLLDNQLIVPEPLLLSFSVWKEAIVLGLATAALLAFARRPRRPRLYEVTALVLLVVIGSRAVSDLFGAAQPIPVLFGARQLAEFLVLFLAVSELRPSPRWFLGTARPLAAVVAVSALVGVAQPSLGAGYYDHVFHRSGELLHHSYLVDLGYDIRFRAVGTFVAPNEFGLGLVVLGSTVLIPLLAVPTSRRWLVAGTLVIAGAAYMLTFSRSAWVGGFVGVMALALMLRKQLSAAWQMREHIQLTRQSLIGIASAIVVAAGLLFISIGGVELLMGTVSGNEPSAAGRGESLAGGIRQALDHAGGLGLGTAGPTALEHAGTAILTENWFLVYGIQLGLIPMGLLGLFVLLVAGPLLARPIRWWRRAVLEPIHENGGLYLFPVLVATGASVALVGAMFGALVIPALLDLPGSLILWSVVAMVLCWCDDDVFVSGVAAPARVEPES